MKNCNLVAYLLLASAVTTFQTQSQVRADTLGKSHLIAQSRRQYECSINGVRPRIPGSVVRDSNCFAPISAGDCIAHTIGAYGLSVGSGPSGMVECDESSRVIKDPSSEKKYYRFFSGDKFVLGGS